MKTIKILLSVAVFSILIGVTAFAALPETMWPGDPGNTTGLIVITKPPKDRSATFDRSYVISGYGKEGTIVAIYKLEGGRYVKTAHTWQIGASTYFAVPIVLDKGKNLLRVGAEDSSGTQKENVNLEITYLGNHLSDVVSGITVDPNNIPY
ncbi:MAG: hypothetical protein LBH54_01495 [Clostridiales bacterium]|jgi:hypothetical protein|nr:hypothetical protein [Clostridiales bacterium]